MTPDQPDHKPQCNGHAMCPRCQNERCVQVVMLDRLSRPVAVVCLECKMCFATREDLKP